MSDTNVISIDEFAAKHLEPALRKLADEMYPFEAWWHGSDSITVRSRRALYELKNDPQYYLEGWMRAAFDAGFEAAKRTNVSGSNTPNPKKVD